MVQVVQVVLRAVVQCLQVGCNGQGNLRCGQVDRHPAEFDANLLTLLNLPGERNFSGARPTNVFNFAEPDLLLVKEGPFDHRNSLLLTWVFDGNCQGWNSTQPRRHSSSQIL